MWRQRTFILSALSVALFFSGIQSLSAEPLQLPPEGRVKALSPKELELKKILDGWEQKKNAWKEAYLKADATEQARLWETQPDGMETTRQVWNLIRTGLNSPWSIPGITWLMDNPGEFIKFPPNKVDEIRTALLDSMENTHALRPEAKEMCASLAKAQNPRAKTILEKIFRSNSDLTAKGFAALAISQRMRIGSMGAGDDEEILKVRGGYFHYALQKIDTSFYGDDYGGQKLVDVLREEMYILKNLTLGNKPPRIKSATLDGSIFDTNEADGKVQALFFWNPESNAGMGLLTLIDGMYKKMGAKRLNMVVICHFPADELKKIKEENNLTVPLIADDARAIHMDYRIGRNTEAVLLDKQGNIRFKQVIQALMSVVPVVEQLIAEKPKPQATTPAG